MFFFKLTRSLNAFPDIGVGEEDDLGWDVGGEVVEAGRRQGHALLVLEPAHLENDVGPG